MAHINSIMKKITFIIIIQGFFFNLIFSQSVSDIDRLKKQYQEIINQQASLNKDEGLDLDLIDGNLGLPLIGIIEIFMIILVMIIAVGLHTVALIQMTYIFILGIIMID